MKAIICFIFVLVALSYSEVNVVVDLSHWNEDTNFSKAKENGLVGVIHKATQGATYSDPKYATKKSAAEKEGLLWGAYHFGVGGKSGEEQANHFLSVAGDSSKVLLALMIVVHEPGMSIAEAEEFVRTVKERTGRYPILYGNSNSLKKFGTPTLKKCPLWIAHYTNNPSPRLPPDWNSWVLWQYTDGRTGGSPRVLSGLGSVDRDRYSGTLEQLRSKWPSL